MLYLVATPIGNLEDISFRALETLKRVDYILAEDTRHSLKLLSHYEIQKSLHSLHQHNEQQKLDKVLQDLANGKEIALISDAGTPLISDPGFPLVKACREQSIPVTAIPGASSVLVALSLSGFEPTPFQFVGFLPRKLGELTARLEAILAYEGTTICYESPERLTDTLTALAECNPDCNVAIARELTKRFESVISGTSQHMLAQQKATPALGEIVVLIEGCKASGESSIFSKELLQALVADVAQECSTKDAIVKVANQLNLPKRTVYNAIHQSSS
ncbi:MAG: 16S rRNA (cytidine(1402)-2'-O)-methyltransferase [Chlamydiales bacterium]|nr:16S rRNA (cytidine(1402)-2'-O)-methyltransferase [Chlamydiales bacterium]